MEKARSAIEGFSLIEILLASALLIIVASTLVIAYIVGQESLVSAGRRAQAIFLAEEGLEASRNIRDSNFSDLTVGAHGVASSSNQWVFSGSQDTTNMFTRQVIVSSIDGNRKIASSTVTWQQTPSRTGTVSLGTRFTNWPFAKKGLAPSLFGTLDLTNANSGHDTADAISVATAGNYVYLGRARNPSSEFFVINVTDPASPTISGQLALNGNPNDIAISGSYAYIASDDNAGELTVVDVSTPSSPTIAATFDLTAANSGNANTDALSVTIRDATYLYLTRSNSGGKEFYVFNISTPTAPSLISSIDLAGDIDESVAAGNYAYLSSTDNTSEFQLIDVTTVTSPTLAASLDLDQGDTAADGLSIAVGASTVYLGRNGSTGGPEFYIIDVTTPATPSITSSMDIGTHVLKSIDYSSSWQLVFFANTNPANDDYDSVDVSIPGTPTLLTSLNLDGSPSKLIYSSSLDKVFIASGSDTQELQVVAP